MENLRVNCTDRYGPNTTDIIMVDSRVLFMFSAVLGIVTLISIIGDIVSVVVIYRVSSLHKPVFVFTANIACADILMLVISLPYSIACLILGPRTALLGYIFCLFQSHINYMTASTVLFFLAITAVYRMTQVAHNSVFTRINSIKWIVSLSLLAWTVPVALCLVFGGCASYDMLRFSCSFAVLPLMGILAALYGPLVFLFVVSYFQVILFFRRSRKQIHSHMQLTETQTHEEKELEVYRPILIIFVIFVSMFLVPGVLYLVTDYIKPEYKPTTELCGSIFSKLRPVFNLVTIIATSSNFRSAFWDTFCFKCN